MSHKMLDKYQRINKQGSLPGGKVILCSKGINKRGELSAQKWLLSIFAVALLLCGCADSAIEEGAKEYVHISLFCDVDFWVPPKWETEEDTITGKITQKTNVVVDTNVPPQDANSHLRLMLANGELPDVISVTDKTTISQLVSSGKVWSLEELLGQYLPDSHLLKDFPQDVKEGLVQRDGGWYAYPSHLYSGDVTKIWPPSSQCYQDMVDYGYNNGIIWRKQLLDKLSLKAEDLKTETQVLQAWEKALEAGDFIPLLLDGQNYQDSTLIFLRDTFGAEPVTEDGAYIDFFLQPEMKDALWFLNQVIQCGYLQPEMLMLSNAELRELLKEGKALCFVGNTANIDVDPAEWVTSGPILSEKGKRPVYGKEETASLGWINTFFSKSCEHPQELAKWLDYMTSNEGMLLWNYGEEGMYYEWEDGLVRRKDSWKEVERNSGKTGIGAWWMFANTAWERHVIAPYEEGSREEADQKIRVTYGKAKETHKYNNSLLNFSLDEDAKALESRITEYKASQVAKIILAEDAAQFEEKYQDMLQGLQELGIGELDSKKNEAYQKNCQEQGSRIQKVND